MGRQQTAKKKKKTSSGKTVRRTKLKQFVLNNEERLELENLQLKEGAIRERLGVVAAQQNAWGKAVAEKYGVKLQEFVIDPDTGLCERRELKPVKD